ncbi:hypothetical protein N0Z46_14080, partial [Acinetobacter baumannii]|nr:hypothetical protein [Acinetobacter baumannii]MDG5703498.1 hypothetical protein [Acinetobacter baumannii]MDG5714435.1 hypothetical protein [Acinetobacter baumannii]
MKILFLHGLDSSRESTKFHAILHPEKFCIDVDYRNLSYASVKDFYHQAIETIKPDSVHDKFHRTLILSGFCLLKIAKISL